MNTTEPIIIGYAIRIVSESHSNYYIDPSDLLKKFIVGGNLDEAQFFIEKENAERVKANLIKFLDRHINMDKTRTVRDLMNENDKGFQGFEIVEVEFESVYFVIVANIQNLEVPGETQIIVREIFFDSETGRCVVSLSNGLGDDTTKFYSRKNAQDQITMSHMAHHPLANHLSVKNVFVNPKLSED